MHGRNSRALARRAFAAFCASCVLAAAASAAGDIAGYARCGGDYVDLAADPDAWTDGQREAAQWRIEERYSAAEIAAASADDPALEARAAEQGLFVVDCADLFPPAEAEDDWMFEEDSFMD